MTLKEILSLFGKRNKELQPHLNPIIEYLEGHETVLKDLEKMLEGLNKSTPPATFDVSPDAMRAFKAVLLPQIELFGSNMSSRDWDNLEKEVMGLGRSKTPSLEQSLIVYKPVTMANKRFWEEIQKVFSRWRQNR
jgi:hypothetical protein